VYYRPEIFELFERLREEGKIQHLGVSVAKVEEGLKAIEYDNVTAVQIIFNIFRQRPAELFFAQAAKRDVGIIVRVPLASGLLTGKFGEQTTFQAGDHRHDNRQGEQFDRGETFAGVDYETGLRAVERIKALFPGENNLAPRALQWILQFPEVSCIIPGVSRPEQLTSNLRTLNLPPLTEEQMTVLRDIYREEIKPLVHHLW
jgi:aryl-alcohol dehydrogenase-like predicted oxidoreductase